MALTDPEARPARPHCYACDKPQSMCLCRHLKPIQNTIGVHILQHPRERHHPLGTARLLRLGLASVKVHVLELRGQGAGSPPIVLPEGSGLLYPSEGARDLATLSPEERPAHLVLIDGTWAHANRIYRDNPWISALPKFSLSPREPGRYRIRTEPRLECLSTVETVVAALRHLQPELRGTEILDAAFDAMIDEQIAASARDSTHSRKKRVRQRECRAIPEPMRTDGARILVVDVEAAPIREGDPEPRLPIRICAVSIDGSRVFDRMIRPRHAPNARELAYLELEREDLEPAADIHEVLAAFHAFGEDGEGEGPVVQISWGGGAQRWLQGPDELHSVMLKGVWANLCRERVPGLDVLVDSLGLTLPALPLKGRAGRRLSRAWAMTHFILSGRDDASGA